MKKSETNAPGFFPGTVKSGLARIRRELKNLNQKYGYPLGKVEGRYHPYGPRQRITPGLQAHRVGCSRSISISYTVDHEIHETDAQREQRKSITRSAWVTLRARGLPVDDKGWMDCRFYNNP